MPFGLKNARATYQRLVNKMFEDQIGRTMEVYVDDTLVKSSRSQDHIVYLEQTFATLRKFRMKLNSMKCTFGVTGEKFLGYLVSERGIEMNPERIEAILKLKSPTTIKEVQKLTGKLASLNCFISKSSDRNLHFFKVLRKTKNFEWTDECERAFQDLKTFLPSPPFTNLKGNEVLYVYLAVSDNAVSSALVREEDGVQSPIYYVSKMLQGAEKRYAQIEKLALALIVTARKPRPYFQGHRIVVLTNHLLRNVLARLEASGRLVKWEGVLGEFDIEYQARTALKGQVLADFMVELVGEPETEPKLDKWMLHVDGSSNAGNGGIGILIQVNEKPSWKDEIVQYLKEGSLPTDPIDPEKAEYVMREIHEGSCGNHSRGRSLAEKVIRQGYFWPTLVEDTKELVKKCEACQKFAIQIHALATQMEPGLSPLRDLRKKFIVVAVEYFSKWVEAEAVAKVTEGNMIEFIWKNIICRFGSNGQVEVANRTILQHLKTRLDSKRSWLDELLGVLWAYRTTPRSSTGETPFCFVFGTEALIPAEIGEESHRVTMYNPMTNHEERLLDLELIEEKKREVAYAKMLHHKSLMMRSYNKRLRPRQFQVGDLVLKKVEVSKHVEKLDPG
ncbi:UNVERIFIED_CONTAM: Retrovirus-related Pol polyprotein from transposon 17.6 [Sesamum indicum]